MLTAALPGVRKEQQVDLINRHYLRWPVAECDDPACVWWGGLVWKRTRQASIRFVRQAKDTRKSSVQI